MSMTEETLVRHVIVEGFVQGVGYRDFARRAALRLGVSGWVRNRSDGTVEALIAGAPADVEAMLAEMRRGPRGAAVANLRLLDPDSADQAKMGAFVIRPTR
jgi:acylphosphatase